MAETDAAAEAGGGLGELLTRKIGPLPAGAWAAIAIVIFLYMRKRGSAGTGAQTDAAGNTGVIDPATGYVQGSSQDEQALASQNGGGTGTGTGAGTSGGSTVAGTYSDNTAWAQAAINYLVSIGEDAVSSNSAVTQYLASQPLTSNQQALVNLAIQRIGSPPSPPQPGTAPPPIVTPPGPGQVYATNPPTGLAVAPSGATALVVKWNRSSNAKGYTIKWGTSAAATSGSTTVSGTAGTTTITGLKPNTHYFVQVQATPAKAGDPFATGTATTAKSTTPGGGGSAGGGHEITVTVAAWKPKNTPWNSTLSGIADHYHVSGGAAALAKLNHITDPNKIEAGQKIKVPVSS